MKKFVIIFMFMLMIFNCGNIAVLSYSIIKEVSRDENYKLMEMNIYENGQVSGKVTFELPVEWYSDGTLVMGLRDNEDNYRLKVDIINIINTTRELIMNEHNELNGEFIGYIEESIYETENYEIFYYKYISSYSATTIRAYYLYKNNERFAICGYVFEEDIPEYDDIFNRIAESVKFQSNLIGVTSSSETGDNILFYTVILLPIAVILKKFADSLTKRR